MVTAPSLVTATLSLLASRPPMRRRPRRHVLTEAAPAKGSMSRPGVERLFPARHPLQALAVPPAMMTPAQQAADPVTRSRGGPSWSALPADWSWAERERD